MDLGLTNKVAVVTGASRGIGRAVSELLLAEGMRVVLVARTTALLQEIASASPDCLAITADLREPDAANRIIAEAVAHFGRLDVLINNAGATRRGDFLTLNEEDWADGFALKFFGAVRCCRASWPHLRATAGGILNIAGVGGRAGSEEFTIGGAVNSALLNLTKALADRGVREGVRVNALNPGSIATDRLKGRIDALGAQRGIDTLAAEAQMAEALRIRRFGTPIEVARVAAFLISPASSYCTGSIVDVDGGQTRAL